MRSLADRRRYNTRKSTPSASAASASNRRSIYWNTFGTRKYTPAGWSRTLGLCCVSFGVVALKRYRLRPIFFVKPSHSTSAFFTGDFARRFENRVHAQPPSVEARQAGSQAVKSLGQHPCDRVRWAAAGYPVRKPSLRKKHNKNTPRTLSGPKPLG